VTANKLNFEMSAQVYEGTPIRKFALRYFERSTPFCLNYVIM